MKYGVVIVANGSGSRINLGYNKVYYRFDDNKTILEKSIDIFYNDDNCEEIVVVSDIGLFNKEIGCKYLNKLVLVRGGSTRGDSVFNGLKAVYSDYVLIHDGARPFLKHEFVNDLLDNLRNNDACLLMISVKDSIKLVRDGYIEKSIDRNSVMFAQTPQAFKTSLIFDAYLQARLNGFVGSDDASVVEMFTDSKIKVVMGDEYNKKITTRSDLDIK